LPRDGFDEVFAIDGGSTDGTVEFLRSQGVPVFPQRRRSLNAAYAEAVFRTKAEALVVFFPKGTIHPACLHEIERGLDRGFDLVIASRNLPGARNEEDARLFRPRKWGVSALAFVAALLWWREGWRVRDVLHGVKGFTVEAFRRMQVSEHGVAIDLEMVVRAYRLRIPRMEIPVRESVRTSGASKFPIWRTGRRLARFLVGELFRSATAR
jgi:hypothetical protein